MSFSITQYIDEVKNLIQDFDVKQKTAFCVWCMDGIFVKNFNFMVNFFEKPIIDKILKDSSNIWNTCIYNDINISSDRIEDWIEEYVEILNNSDLDWQVNRPSERECYHHFSTIKFFECLLLTLEIQRVDNSELAATCAEYFIDSIDFELSMLVGVARPLESDLIKLEIEYQQQMLGFLKQCNHLTIDDRFIIRNENMELKQIIESYSM